MRNFFNRLEVVAVTMRPADTSPAALPTVKYPNGKLVKLFYDDNSFYMLNLSDTAIPINQVSFERLSNEEVALNRFNDLRRAEFYPDSTTGKCVVLEIFDRPPYLDPVECGRGVFLSLGTPGRDNPAISGLPRKGVTSFGCYGVKAGRMKS